MLDDLKFSAKFIRDDFNAMDNLNGCSHWEVTLERNGYSVTVEYSQGSAYRKYPNGKDIVFKYHGGYTIYEVEALRKTKPTVPDVKAVLYCLMVDAESVEWNDFESFCAEYGYSTDSKSAESTYLACCNHRIAIKRLGYDLDALREFYQDY